MKALVAWKEGDEYKAAFLDRADAISSTTLDVVIMLEADSDMYAASKDSQYLARMLREKGGVYLDYLQGGSIWKAMQRLSEPKQEKPPIGLKPRCIHDRLRVRELLGAAASYLDAGKDVPLEWIDEAQELLGREA